jgi:hypothetical protein
MLGFQSSEFFLEKPELFELAKISRKYFAYYFLFLDQKTLFLRLKNPVFGSKSLETGVSEHLEFTENSEFVLFSTFQKLQKNDFKIEFRKSRKTRSDSNVGFKVCIAGPYSRMLFALLKSARIKAVHKALVKSTQGRSINQAL